VPCSASRVVPGAHGVVGPGTHRGSGPREVHTTVPCSGLARDVDIKVGQDIFTINAYSIPLDCFDMVLGVSFLKPLHTILLDFDDLVMAFTYNGKRVLWKGL
jgi:hypothetical protein